MSKNKKLYETALIKVRQLKLMFDSWLPNSLDPNIESKYYVKNGITTIYLEIEWWDFRIVVDTDVPLTLKRVANVPYYNVKVEILCSNTQPKPKKYFLSFSV